LNRDEYTRVKRKKKIFIKSKNKKYFTIIKILKHLINVLYKCTNYYMFNLEHTLQDEQYIS